MDGRPHGELMESLRTFQWRARHQLRGSKDLYLIIVSIIFINHLSLAQCDRLITQKFVFVQGEAGLPGVPGSPGQKGDRGEPVRPPNTVGVKVDLFTSDLKI